jgi:hypothetical protein
MATLQTRKIRENGGRFKHAEWDLAMPRHASFDNIRAS